MGDPDRDKGTVMMASNDDAAKSVAVKRHACVSGLFFTSLFVFFGVVVFALQGYSFAKKRIYIDRHVADHVPARLTVLGKTSGRSSARLARVQFVRNGPDGPRACSLERWIDFFVTDEIVTVTPVGAGCEEIYVNAFECFPRFWLWLAAYGSVVGSTLQIYASLIRRGRIRRSFS